MGKLPRTTSKGAHLRGTITIKTLPDECGHVIEIAMNYLQSLNEYFFKSPRFLFYFI